MSKNSIERLKENIDVAILDARDVIFSAEYTNRREFETAKRVRDFNKNFEDSEINVN